MLRLRLTGEAAGRQHHAAFTRIESHRHLKSYATAILAGGYQEAGESGRWRLEPGMIVIHATGEAHADWFGDRQTELIDFHVPDGITAGVYRCKDADALARSALEGEALEGSSFDGLDPVEGSGDWPDLLATALRHDPSLAIGGWARAFGLKHETVSRGFVRAYGVTPARYRLGIRIKEAMNGLTGGDAPLADVAFASGFADQPHMTRALKVAFGSTPAQLRGVKFVQEKASAAH